MVFFFLVWRVSICLWLFFSPTPSVKEDLFSKIKRLLLSLLFVVAPWQTRERIYAERLGPTPRCRRVFVVVVVVVVVTFVYCEECCNAVLNHTIEIKLFTPPPLLDAHHVGAAR